MEQITRAVVQGEAVRVGVDLAKRITRSVQQGRLQRSSLFLVHALQRRLLFLQPQMRTETFDDEYKYSLPKRGSPFNGLH